MSPIDNDTSTEVVVQEALNKNYDYFKVIDFAYSDDTHKGGIARMSVRCLFAVSEKDGAGTITGFTDKLEKEVCIEGQPLADLMFQTPTETTVYADVKAKIYAYLQTLGVFPAGTVE